MTIRHRRAFAVAAVATAALFLACPSAGAALTAPATTTDPAAAAAGWLAQQFSDSSDHPAPDGDHIEGSFGSPPEFFFDGGGTADAIYALAAAKAGKSKIDAALAYLKAHVDEYADLTNGDGFGPNDGGTAKVALAAMVAGADPTSFGDDPTDPGTALNLLKHLKAGTCPDASTTCTPGAGSNIFSSVSQSLIVLAEARAGGGYAPSSTTIDYLLSLQCADGGFTVETAGGANCASDVDATGYAVAALVALGGQQAALDRATGWLLDTRNPAGYWVAQGGPDVDSTGLAASALDAAGQDTSTSRSWLASQQVTTGPTVGAGAARGALKFQGAFDPSTSIKATADGLLGMVPGASLANLTAAGASLDTKVMALGAPRAAKASIAQGAHQTVTGGGFAAREKVSAELHSAPVSLDSVVASKSGTAVVKFDVPASLAPGEHTVVLTGTTSGLTSSVAFTVTAAPAGTTTGPSSGVSAETAGPPPPGFGRTGLLAATGLNGRQVVTEALVGLACVAAGVGIVYLGRRRRT